MYGRPSTTADGWPDMFDPTLLHPYWSPSCGFTVRAGTGSHEVMTLEDLAALIARCEEIGDRTEARRLAGEIDRLCAIAAVGSAEARSRSPYQDPFVPGASAAEADVEGGSNALERAS